MSDDPVGAVLDAPAYIKDTEPAPPRRGRPPKKPRTPQKSLDRYRARGARELAWPFSIPLEDVLWMSDAEMHGWTSRIQAKHALVLRIREMLATAE